MITRSLSLVASLLLISVGVALYSFAKQVGQVAAISKTTHETQLTNIENLITGQTLATTLDNITSTPTLHILNTTANKQKLALLQPETNIQQLLVINIETDRINRHSRRLMRRFSDKLPLLNSNSNYIANHKSSNAQNAIDKLLAYAKQNKGIPYKWGGISTAGFDCSGFTQYAFKHIGVKIPRTSHRQSKLGTAIALNDAKAGDLVFFGRKRGNTYRTNHTGIVIGNKQGVLQVIHSARRGVVVDNILSMSSYKRRFLFVKRIL